MDVNLVQWMLLLMVLSFLQDVVPLKLMQVHIPEHTIHNTSVSLHCRYDLEGAALYSVKWYKDGVEFYRYIEEEQPPAQIFRVPGIFIDIMSSNDSSITLNPVTLESSGVYECEVSTEGPFFQTVMERGTMIVAALPGDSPEITGGRKSYQVDDIVNVTCSLGGSKPAASLEWYINGERAEPRFTRGPHITVRPDGLESVSLQLIFRVRQEHFRNGDMKLKCLATIATIYWRTNEEHVQSDKDRAPAMAISNVGIGGASRAHMAQAAGCGSPSSSWYRFCLYLATAFASSLISAR